MLKNKKLIYTITLFVGVAILSFFGCNSEDKRQEDLGDEELKQLVIDYGNAMNELAASSLGFGADTETQWAIDTVNQIWENCQAQPFDLIQYMADIATMEKYFAYGIDYVPLMFYWSKHYYDPQEEFNYKYMFDEVMYVTDSLRQVVKTQGEWHDYFTLHAYTLSLVDLYFAFFDDLNENPTEQGFGSLYNSDVIDSLFTKDGIDPIFYAWQVDGASFYCRYSVFIGRTSEDNDALKERLINYAYIMDGFSQPIFSAENNNKQLPKLTTTDNELFLRTAFPIYTDMLRMLAKRLKELGQQEVEEY